jgi:membrane protease YdiL (CAAX protease family)
VAEAIPSVPSAQEAVTTADAPTRPLLRAEVLIVLALSYGMAGLYALVDLLRGYLVVHQPLSQQAAVVAAPAASQAWLDISYQALDIATTLAPVFLVAYLLTRSGESMSAIGVDGSQPGEDARWSLGLAALVGAVGLGLLFAAKALGINRNIIIGNGANRWWDVVLLVAQAAKTAIGEEVIVGGYLLLRFKQLGWGDNQSLVVSSVVRGSYHLYQGWGGFGGNFVLGLFFGRLFQRRGRVLPFIVAHFIIDAIAFVGYIYLKRHASWLP